MRKLFFILLCLSLQGQSLVYATGNAMPCPMKEQARFSHCEKTIKKATEACKTCCKHPVNCDVSASLAAIQNISMPLTAIERQSVTAHTQTEPRQHLLREVWRPPLMI